MIRGTSYTIDLIFNAEYITTRVTSMILTIGNYDVCSLAGGSIVRSGQHFLCSIPSDITAVLPVGERPVTLTMDDTTDGVRKAIIATIPIQNTGSQYENENVSETANMTLELTYMVNNISADLLITDVSAQRAIAAALEAKASEDAALLSKNAAAQSETNAATSETNAGISAANALTSEQNAATSEQNAGTSETNAGVSETNAGISAGNAAQSAIDSDTRADAALISEQNAAGSASAANTSKNFASGYADAANADRILAQTAKTGAETAQGITEGFRDETEAFRNAAAAIVSGGPRMPPFANLAALNAANPDHQFTYLTSDNGHWNAWNGTAFESGGVYQTVADYYIKNDVSAGKSLKDGNNIYIPDGSIYAMPEWVLSKLSEDYFTLLEKHKYRYYGKQSDSSSICFYDSNHNIITSVRPGNGFNWTEYEFICPEGVKYCRAASETGDFRIVDITDINDLFASKKNVVLENDIIANALNTIFTNGGYYGSDGIVVPNADYSYQLNYSEVIANCKYKYVGKIENYLYMIFYNSLHEIIGSKSNGYGTYTEFEFYTPNGCKYIRCTCKTADLNSFNIINLSKSYILGRPNEIIEGAIDYNFVAPIAVFGIENDADSNNQFNREYVANVYPESFLQNKMPVYINDGLRAYPIQNTAKNTNAKESFNKSLTLAGDGYIAKSIGFEYVKTRSSNAKSKSMRVLCHGDSMTALDLTYPDGTKRGGWAYPSMIKELSIKDNIDFGDDLLSVLMVGTKNHNTGRVFDYKGSTHTVRSFSEGIAARSACNLLRHAHWATGDSALYAPVVSFSMLGLVTASGHAYTGSNADKMLIYNTTQKDNWEYDQYTYAVTGNTDTYTGTTEQNNAIDVAMGNLLDNPENLFYSRAKANEIGSQYAYSLSHYLSTQKTLSDDGVTRLSVGSTAGTKVTDINAADVCTPTHIVLTIGENDRWWFPVAAEDVKATLFLLRDAIHAEYPLINIAINNTRMIGSYYPERWLDKGVFPEMEEWANTFKYDLQTLLRNEMGDALINYELSKCFLLPSYHTLSINSFSGVKNATDLDDLESMSIGNADINHPGVAASMSIAYQCLSFIYYTV